MNFPDYLLYTFENLLGTLYLRLFNTSEKVGRAFNSALITRRI